MKKSTKIIAAILLIAGTSSAVFAFSKHDHWKMSPQEKAEFVSQRVTEKLDLDAQQQQRFAELAATVIDIITDAKVGKDENIAEIRQLLSEPSFNQARALEMVQQKTSMINDMAPTVIASLGSFLDTLNSEQKQELQLFMEHHGRHHRNGHDDD